MIEDELAGVVAAAVLGISESRVSQILNGPVKRAMEEAHLREEIGDLYRDDLEYSMLLVKWIRL